MRATAPNRKTKTNECRYARGLDISMSLPLPEHEEDEAGSRKSGLVKESRRIRER